MTSLSPLAAAPRADIEALLDRAFGPDRKARPAYRLREGGAEIGELSFAAWRARTLVGTLQCWPVTLAGRPWVMVGPVAVAPPAQNSGVGRLLMHALLEAAGDRPLMMIGDEAYYARFGFTAALTRDWVTPPGVDPARLLARETVSAGEPVR